MVLCCAVGCPNRTDRKGKFKKDANEFPISYHRFPKDIDLRDQWINAIGRKNWSPSATSVICSVHFTQNCFNRTLSITKLHPNAVPTIFSSSSHFEQSLEDIRNHSEIKMPIVIKQEASEIAEDPLATTSVLGLEETKTKPEMELLIIVKEEASEIEIEEEILDPQPSTSSGVDGSGIQQTRKEMISRGTSPIREYWSELPIVTQMQDAFKNQITDYRKKIKLLHQTKRQQQKKIDVLKNVLKSVKSKMLLLEENVLILNNVCGSNELLNNQLLKVKKQFPKKI